MSKKSELLIFEDYQTFYAKMVAPLKAEHSKFIRLDGKPDGSNRKAFGYFRYQDQIWKVDADSWIVKMDIGLLMSKKTDKPFLIQQTRDGRSKCLTIVDEPLTPKRFYVYLSNIKTKPTQ